MATFKKSEYGKMGEQDGSVSPGCRPNGKHKSNSLAGKRTSKSGLTYAVPNDKGKGR